MTEPSCDTNLYVGEAIWYARERAGLTQAQLASKVLVSRPQIANLETGRGNPSIEVLERIARACRVSFVTDGYFWTVDN